MWAAVGKLGTLIGLLLGLVTLAKFIWAPGARLSANCQIVESAVPPPSLMLAKFLSRIGTLMSAESIEGTLSETYLTSSWTAAQRALMAEVIRDYHYKPAIMELQDLGAPSDLLQCRIRNDGEEPARGVVFDLSDAPLIVMADNRHLPLEGDQKSISLGDIRPGINIDFRAWFPGGLRSLGQFRISHQGGAGRVALFNASRTFPGR
jgi:hypothetical protein